MCRISHSDAIELEYQVRRLYHCNRGGVSGMADADYFERHPIQAAVLIIAYIHANGMESGPYQYDEFLTKYENLFEYSEKCNIRYVIKDYISELENIVDDYV
jgi:hypothetical protein